MSTQVQGLSDNLEEIKSRLGKLNQQLVDLQNSVQSLDAKISGGGVSAPATATPTSSTGAPRPAGSSPNSSALPPGAPSADTLYSNGLRDITSGKYDLARSEFEDYLKFYSDTDLASNAQFYLGEIFYKQKQYTDAVAAYDKVLTNYPKSFKLGPARLRKGMALIELGQKTAGVRELREVVKRYPGSDEDRIARTKLKELGVSVTATR
jgi:tol-pal system protein YbgF